MANKTSAFKVKSWPIHTLFFTIFLFINISVPKPWASATTLTISNKCSHPVWPGIQPNAGNSVVARGGFLLPPNKTHTLQVPPLWGGRVWARLGCSFDAAGKGECITGDCGGVLFCDGLGGTSPATLAEITIGADQTFYDVSLVDGYNLPISITPIKGTGKCGLAGCMRDVNKICPAGLQVRSREGNRVVACNSACMAFHLPNYCCTGSYGSPQTCGPTTYSRIFKRVCPRAYSFAYDDPTSLFSCSNANYLGWQLKSHAVMHIQQTPSDKVHAIH
ncbi:unnamed protein product [Sphenostylis stenocarpa]|uniref:Thaumatin-like protein n=1 Tax=Sphenostylis stenocarpa TaxID=92480 RepID=A0AA86SCP6_9FABA|nr:unnamed protein product [Sphenostylis stenocarpa]